MKKVVIWGAGSSGICTYERIKDEFEVVAFSDNNTNVQGTKVCGTEVVSPEKVYQACRKKSIDSIFMGTATNNYDDVYEQIRANLPEWKDIYYVTQWGSRKILPYTEQDLGIIEFDATRNCNLKQAFAYDR